MSFLTMNITLTEDQLYSLWDHLNETVKPYQTPLLEVLAQLDNHIDQQKPKLETFIPGFHD